MSSSQHVRKIIWVFLIALVAVFALIYFFSQDLAVWRYNGAATDNLTGVWPDNNDVDLVNGDDGSDAVFCTMDAMMCPDGSYVGRSGPNCELSPCPVVDGGSVSPGFLPNDSELSLAEKIAACMPLSNWEARELCQSLLASIQTYQDCELAGFPILESYPTQCVLPDGRNFRGPEYFID